MSNEKVWLITGASRGKELLAQVDAHRALSNSLAHDVAGEA
jgi:hypothetical protein